MIEQTADRNPQCIGETHRPPVPSGGSVTLGQPARIQISIISPRSARAADLVYEAIVAIDTQQPREVLDRMTGELRSIKPRVNKQRVDRYLKEQHRVYLLPDVLDELYPEQLLKRSASARSRRWPS
jgi:hypothetical protein